MYQYTDIANVSSADEPRIVPYLKLEQSLLVKDVDMYEMGKVFTDVILFSKDKETITIEEEPEIDLSSWYNFE